MDYCAKIFPSQQDQFGLSYNHTDLNRKALDFLVKQDYDVTKAKYYLTFPVAYQCALTYKLN